MALLFYFLLTYLNITDQILEKSRGTLQTQFDQWYSNLHSRDGKLSHQSRSAYSTQQRPQQQQALCHSSSSDAKSCDDRAHVQADRKESTRGVHSAGAKPDSGSNRSPRSRVLPKQQQQQQQQQEQQQQQRSAVNDSDEDDDVNEDIEAFYKAKEELLKRRSNKS